KGGGTDQWILTGWRPRGSYRSAFAEAAVPSGQPGAAVAAGAATGDSVVAGEGLLYVQVSTSQNEAWSSEMAQQLSRAGLTARVAAQHGRRVALVDLWIEDPTLHEVVGLTPSEGIVDAFEYGVSLTKAAHEVDHVFFIAAGAYTAHPGDVFGHERWKKLHGGF